MQDLASLARKMLAKLAYFLQDLLLCIYMCVYIYIYIAKLQKHLWCKKVWPSKVESHWCIPQVLNKEENRFDGSHQKVDKSSVKTENGQIP